ncbi:protein Mis18-alpha isoform X1 [Ornithorhynchus anatinus]|nr:protein Mis18-alpha isoform X1 [Ornithorhynchus anatinus]
MAGRPGGGGLHGGEDDAEEGGEEAMGSSALEAALALLEDSCHLLKGRGGPDCEEEEEEEEREGGGRSRPQPPELPLVFLCARCKRPVGDSLAWVASDEEGSAVLLRCVSPNVSVDKEQKLSSRANEYGCLIETLFCAGCSLNLGSIFRCTPRHLDFKRDLFCLSVDAIESYVLGSSEKPAVPESDGPLLTLQSRAVLEEALERAAVVLKEMGMRLSVVESKLASL